MQQTCSRGANRGATEVQQRRNRGATAGSTGMQQKFNGGDASKSAMRAELRRRRRGWWWVGGGGGADAARIRCADCSDGGGGAGAGRAGQDDAGGDWPRQAARPVAARRPSPARHGVYAVATGPTSCRFAPAPPRLRCSRRPRDGTGRRGRGGGLTGGALRRRGPGPSGRQLGPRPCCSGGAPRPRPRGAWGAWGGGGRGGRGRGDCRGDPRVVDVWAARARVTGVKRDGSGLGPTGAWLACVATRHSHCPWLFQLVGMVLDLRD